MARVIPAGCKIVLSSPSLILKIMHFLAAIIVKLTVTRYILQGGNPIKKTDNRTFQKDIFAPCIKIDDCQILAIQVEINVNLTQFVLHLKLISYN